MLVARADEVVDPVDEWLERHERHALRRVDEDPRAVSLRGVEDRADVRDPAGLHLHEADGDELGCRSGRIDATSSKDTSRMIAPRSFATRSGKRVEVNSSAGTTTSSPGARCPATSPVPTDAAGIVAIVSAGAPMSDAKSRGA